MLARGLRMLRASTGTGFAQPNRKLPGQQQQDRGHEHGSDRIHVTDRVEAQAAAATQPCGRRNATLQPQP